MRPLMRLSAIAMALSLRPVAADFGVAASAPGVTTVPLIPHHVQRRRRLEEAASSRDPRRRDEARQVGGLYQGYGTHYIDLWCGTPPQRQTVIVDTGSGITAFPCTGCNDCGVPKYHVDRLFETSESSSFQPSQCRAGHCVTQRGSCRSDKCHISMAYAEGSRWEAYEAVDRCYVGGPHNIPLVPVEAKAAQAANPDDLDPAHAAQEAFDLVFGCQTLLTGLFKTQMADGIMGMDTRQESYWHQMFAHGKMGDKKQFSLCFSRSPTTARSGTQAGAMTLGGYDSRLHRDPSPAGMVYTTGASEGRSGFFSVKVRAAYLRGAGAGESAKSTRDDALEGVVKLNVSGADLSSGGVIVDSGTTDTYWNSAIAHAFTSAFQAMTGKSYNHDHVSMTQEELDALPTILFQLETDSEANEVAIAAAGGHAEHVVGLAGDVDPDHPRDVLLALPPSHYMEYDADKDSYVARFYVTERGGSVLGANAMMGHDVLFDVDEDRIGWAESDCDYTKAVRDGGFPDALRPKDGPELELGDGEETTETTPETTETETAPETTVEDEKTEPESPEEKTEPETPEETPEEKTEPETPVETPEENTEPETIIGTPTEEEKIEAENTIEKPVDEEREDPEANPEDAETAATPEENDPDDNLEKKEPENTGGDTHDVEVPSGNGLKPPQNMEEAQAQLQNLKDACDSPACQAAAIGSAVLGFILLVCCCRCCCCRPSPQKYQPAPLEIELNERSGYKDEPTRADSFYDEDDDGEFDGDFR